MVIAIIASVIALGALSFNVWQFLYFRRALAQQAEKTAELFADAVAKARALVLLRDEEIKENAAHIKENAAHIKENAARIKDLESGIVPDFEQAKEAVSALDSFNAGISGILGYDPYEALKKAREKENGGVNE